MKLTSIEIRPDNSASGIELSFRDPGSFNPFQIQSVTGLDIDQVVPRSYRATGKLPAISKSTGFYAMSLLKRQVAMKIGLNPRFSESESFSDLRDALYRIVASTRTGKLNLLFKNRIEVVAILSGFVSKSENPLFEKAQTVQLTIQCDDPMLRAPEAVELKGLNPTGPVTHGDVVVMPTSSIATIRDNKSTAPHGFAFIMEILQPLAYIQIIDPEDTTWFFKILPNGGFLTGDVLHFSSEDNNKGLWMSRSSSTIQLGDSITPNSDWPIMFPGDNAFEFGTPDKLKMLDFWYYPTYWGV